MRLHFPAGRTERGPAVIARGRRRVGVASSAAVPYRPAFRRGTPKPPRPASPAPHARASPAIRRSTDATRRRPHSSREVRRPPRRPAVNPATRPIILALAALAALTLSLPAAPPDKPA